MVMEMIREKCNASNLTRYYRTDRLSDVDAIIHWLCEIRAIDNLDISYIVLRDMNTRSDERSDTLRLAGDIQNEEILCEVKARNIDVISMRGTYAGKPVVIGAKLRRFEVFVTVRLSNMADIDAIEKELL